MIINSLSSLNENFQFFDNEGYVGAIDYNSLGLTIYTVLFFTVISLDCLFFRANSVLEVIF